MSDGSCRLLVLMNWEELAIHHMYSYMRYLQKKSALQTNGRKPVNEHDDMPRCKVVPKFSDLEIIALNMISEANGSQHSLALPKQKKDRDSILALCDRFMIVRNYAKDT